MQIWFYFCQFYFPVDLFLLLFPNFIDFLLFLLIICFYVVILFYLSFSFLSLKRIKCHTFLHSNFTLSDCRCKSLSSQLLQCILQFFYYFPLNLQIFCELIYHPLLWFFLRFIYVYKPFVWIFMCTPHACLVPKEVRRRHWIHLKLEKLIVLSCPVNAGNRILVLSKSSKWPWKLKPPS